jgi:hypothetical protein
VEFEIVAKLAMTSGLFHTLGEAARRWGRTEVDDLNSLWSATPPHQLRGRADIRRTGQQHCWPLTYAVEASVTSENSGSCGTSRSRLRRLRIRRTRCCRTAQQAAGSIPAACQGKRVERGALRGPSCGTVRSVTGYGATGRRGTGHEATAGGDAHSVPAWHRKPALLTWDHRAVMSISSAERI